MAPQSGRLAMIAQPKNILITGLPGSGKTTLIRKIADDLSAVGLCGFFTEEIREQGVRKGFALRSVDGRAGILAHVDHRGPFRIGKYGVDIPGFEEFLASLGLPGAAGNIVIIDEIGRMECLSSRFRGLVTSLLDSPTPVVATIALRGTGLIEEIRHRPDIDLVPITKENRPVIAEKVAGKVRSLLGRGTVPPPCSL